MTIPDKLEFTISFPADQGFLGRECNAPACQKYFRVHTGSLKTEMHCPYCGDLFRNDELWTSDQIDYARRKAKHEVMPLVEQEVRDMFRRAFQGKPGWTFKPGPPVTQRPEPPLPMERGVDSELTCPQCESRFQVDGIFGYCPGCRAENLLLYDANLRVIEQEVAEASNPVRALRHAYGDLVTTFEVFSRREAQKYNIEAGRFQNLDYTRRLFRSALGVDVFANLDVDDIRTLKCVFEKRHVHEHNKGIVSERYVREVPEHAHLLGMVAPLSLEELRRGASILRRVLEVLVSRRMRGSS